MRSALYEVGLNENKKNCLAELWWTRFVIENSNTSVIPSDFSTNQSRELNTPPPASSPKKFPELICIWKRLVFSTAWIMKCGFIKKMLIW